MKRDAVLMRLDTIKDRDEAQRWKGAAVHVEASHLPPPGQGYHVYELIGSSVIDDSGQHLGDVTGFLDNSAHFLLKLNKDGQELLFPYVEDFVKGYERESNSLIVTVPPGLWDTDDTQP
jgi:16S rRNA processing protein RimM